MASCFFLQQFFYLSFIIFLAIPLSNGEYAPYTACSVPYSCGNMQDVRYPFWGENRPKFCGIPDLKLLCDKNHSSSVTSVKVLNNEFGYFKVLHINKSSKTMVLSIDYKVLRNCKWKNFKPSSVSLLSTFKLDASYENISLGYGCNSTCNSSRYHSKSFSCSYDSDDPKTGSVYYFYNISSINNIPKSCSCNNSIPFPVDKKVLDKIRRTKVSLLSLLTESSIKIMYEANLTACSNCEKSGGKCGSSDNNQFVCHCQDGPQTLGCMNKTNKLGLILGLGIGGTLLVLVVLGFWHRKKLKVITCSASLNDSVSELEKEIISFTIPLFSYCELVEATSNFDQSKELGSGGFGVVYYGKLKDGREVAVKRLYEKSYKRLKQFMNEIQILTRLRHQNLVSLYGCTSLHCRELLLVYEYVNNGTVADHLYGKCTKSVLLPWPVRLRIAIETASALSYLHASDIIHRDVKTNNILLDCNFSVKVADFGLCRLFPTDVTHVSTAPQGTPGYLDPEYSQCYQLTDKSDVYSFGVVLIELISSLPAIDMDRPKHEINLFNYAMNRIQRCAFDELVDPLLGFALDFKVRRMTVSVAELAFQCLQHDKELRPSMDEVLEVLKSIEGADYEALQAEEMANYVGFVDDKASPAEEMADTNVEVCEASKAEEKAKIAAQNSDPEHTAMEDDYAQLLNNNHRAYSSSPISVMVKWVGSSTTSSSSK